MKRERERELERECKRTIEKERGGRGRDIYIQKDTDRES